MERATMADYDGIFRGFCSVRRAGPDNRRATKGVRPGFTGIVLLALIVGGSPLTIAGQTFDEFPIPTSDSAPLGIAAGSDGALWFTYNATDKIGRITTAGVITEFATPTARSGPTGITAGPDGALWFIEYHHGAIAPPAFGRITTAGVITELIGPIQTSSGPGGIAAASDGALWFTDTHGNRIGRITTAGIITEFTVPTAGSLPTGIAAGPDGALWFTEHGGNKIGRIAVEVPLVPRAPISRVPTRRPVRSR